MSYTSSKKELLAQMRALLADLKALRSKGDAFDSGIPAKIFSLEEEVAYLERRQGLNKKECERIRVKFGLAETPERVPLPMGLDSKKAARRTVPIPVATITGPIQTLPAHQKVALKPEFTPQSTKRDPERILYEQTYLRYCVTCDALLIQDGPRYVCPNLTNHYAERSVTC